MGLSLLAAFALLLWKEALPYRLHFDGRFALLVFLVMFVLVLVHSSYRKRRLEQLVKIGNFDVQVQAYEKLYSFTLWWYLLSCLVSCVVGLLTMRFIFLYFAVYDLIIMLRFYPKASLFRKELQNDEIVLST